jgi:tRNA A-37 threonylcarbamoyl transferase component Bud32
MEQIKDTRRSTVRVDYFGRVFKTFRGHQARERFENELRVLKYLEKRGCPFVPRVLEADADNLLLVTSNVGRRVDHISPEKLKSLYTELESYGVRHGDPDVRNITYCAKSGRFNIIDFEFATILEDPTHVSPKPGLPET